MNRGLFERYKETIVFKFSLYLLLSAKYPCPPQDHNEDREKLS